MECAYVVCPVCWDKLIQVTSEEEYVSYRKDKKCSKCGTHFGLALHGKKIDDTTYQINFKRGIKLDDMRITGMRKSLNEVHLDADAILKAIEIGKRGSLFMKEMHFTPIYLPKCF